MSAGNPGAIEPILAACRSRITRVSPLAARHIQSAGGLLVDIRPAEQRARFGEVPGALVIERNVLEWRLDPTGPHRHPGAGPPGRPVVVFCQEGFASSLAVDSLRLLGVPEVSDLEGGYEAWRSAGLPVTGPAP
jgi:rhodanese-related sulfurtransferase